MLKRLNITRKRAYPQKFQEVNWIKIKAKRRNLILQYLKYLKHGFKFIFIDESSLNVNVYPLYGYSNKGQRFKVLE